VRAQVPDEAHRDQQREQRRDEGDQRREHRPENEQQQDDDEQQREELDLAAGAGGAALVRDVGRPGNAARSPAGRARAKVACRSPTGTCAWAPRWPGWRPVAFEELLSRFPDFTCDETRVERGYSSNVRGLAKLPLWIELLVSKDDGMASLACAQAEAIAGLRTTLVQPLSRASKCW